MSSSPSVSVVATSRCQTNLLPVPTPDQLADGTFLTVGVVATGNDPRNSGGLLTAETTAEFFLGGDEADGSGGTGGRFTSSGESVSGPIPFNGRSARDEFFCTSQGTVTLHVRVKDYMAGGTEPAATLRNLATRGFPVRCVSKANYEAQCGAPVEDFGADAGDAAPTDAGMGSDADVGPDSEPPPPNWGINYQRVADEEAEICIRGSGLGCPFSIKLDFLVTENGEPVGNVPVDFALPDRVPPNVDIEAIDARTRPDGIASVRLVAGGTPGVVNVTARAHYRDETEEDRSQVITIRAGIPSLRGMNFLCQYPIIPAFTSRISPVRWLFGQGEGVNCTVQLGDRVNGRVDKSTQVFFLAEAGTVDQVATVPEDGSGLVGTTLFIGPPAPYDTQPLPYEAAAGYGTDYNPRDGLVRIVAVTRGEESFTDLDGDGIYADGLDLLEPSDDLPDPFIDINDDGTWQDDGEPCSDRDDACAREEFRDADNDGFWTPANETWDADTEIWVSTTVLWVGRANAPELAVECVAGACNLNAPINGDCPVGRAFYIDGGGIVRVSARWADDNGNCVDAQDDAHVTVAAVGASLMPEGFPTIDLEGQHCYNFDDRAVFPERPIAQPVFFTLSDNGPPLEADVPRPPSLGTVDLTLDYPSIGGQRVRQKVGVTFCR